MSAPGGERSGCEPVAKRPTARSPSMMIPTEKCPSDFFFAFVLSAVTSKTNPPADPVREFALN
jgi:hypothetical protein